MNPWERILSTVSVDDLLTTLGVGFLAFLFARDLILTKAQHLRRVQDLIDHHQREREEKDGHIGDIRASRDSWKEAARAERERADRVVDSYTEVAAALRDIQHILESLDRALPAPRGGAHE